LETKLEHAHLLFDMWSKATKKGDFDYADFMVIGSLQSR
jgi:hypothetical protein